MQLISDLHLHSKYSRACSQNISLENLSKWAKIKGLNLLGTGDFTHPLWLKELKQNLKEEREGFYSFNEILFALSTEVCNVFKSGGKERKVHHIILAPNFEIVDQINFLLSKFGDLKTDGRPILNLSAIEMIDYLKEISNEIEIIPAHVWTPYFGLFGSKSGFDSFEECYGDREKEVHAIETGMSSDPAMNWRLSSLDKKQILSFSDSHSFWPWRLGREATIFDLKKISYRNLVNAIRTGEGLIKTIETSPSYGKYHADGHRSCGIWFEPSQSLKYNNTCPKCGKKWTIGVMHRVEELADRPKNFIPKDRPPFYTLLPLSELLATVYNTSPNSKKIDELYATLIKNFKSELDILLNVSFEDLIKILPETIAKLLLQNRLGTLKIRPGYDGVYGKLILTNTETFEGPDIKQQTLSDFT
ncbi:MAG: endonuclease Q family protein [Candidatus Nanoarchaeia archaeon]